MNAIGFDTQMELLADGLCVSEVPAAAGVMAEMILAAAKRAAKIAAEAKLAAMDRYPDLTPWCDDEECVMGVWQNRLPEREQGVVFSSSDEEKQMDDQAAWERETFLDTRRPLSAFEPADWSHGYRLDPRFAKNESALEREYGPKRYEVETDYARDETGAILLADDGSRLMVEETVLRQGSVGWLYDRLTKKVDGKPAGLPWLPKATYKWFRESERRYATQKQLRLQQRRNIIVLARKIGRDPSSPTFGAWVTENGYPAAQARLLKAYQQQLAAAKVPAE